jgi:hypothetical protein
MKKTERASLLNSSVHLLFVWHYAGSIFNLNKQLYSQPACVAATSVCKAFLQLSLKVAYDTTSQT